MRKLGIFGVVIAVGVLSACGGGGGGGGGNSNSSPSQQTSSLSSSASGSSVGNLAMTRQTAPEIVGAFADLVEYSSGLPAQIDLELFEYSKLGNSIDTTGNCPSGGKASIKISNAGQLIEEKYQSCNDGSVILSGERSITVAKAEGDFPGSYTYVYKQFLLKDVAAPAESQLWDGKIAYTGKLPSAVHTSTTDSPINTIQMTVSIDDSAEGFLAVKDFEVHLPYTSDSSWFGYLFYFMGDVSGSFTVNGTQANISERRERFVKFASSNGASISVEDYESGELLKWDANNDGAHEAVLYETADHLGELIDSSDPKIVTIQTGAVSNDSQFYMARGATLDLYVYENFTSNSGELLDFQINGMNLNSGEWEQPEPGHFRLKFSSNTEDKNYPLTITATDAYGNKSTALTPKVYVGADIDGDGLPNVIDFDSDNDNVEDSKDKFPFDQSESADSDGDGIGNNHDPDNDPSVQKGTIWLLDKNGILYFTPNERSNYVGGVRKAYSKRWDTKTKAFLADELVLPGYSTSDGFYYAKEMNRLYFFGRDDVLAYVDLDTLEYKPVFKVTELFRKVTIDFATADYLVVNYNTSFYSSVRVYDKNSQLVSSTNDAITYEAVRAYPPGLVSFCGSYITIDEAGKLYQVGDFNAKDPCRYVPDWLPISLDGLYVYKYSSSSAPEGIYDIHGSLVAGVDLFRAFWLPSGLVSQGDGMLLHSPQGVLLKQFSLDTSSATILHNDSQVVVSSPTQDGKHKLWVLNAELNLTAEYFY